MSERRLYDVKLTLRSPFMFEGTVNTRTGVDSAFLRDHAGRPIIPSSQVRGVLRAALGELARATGGKVIKVDEIDLLFGVKSSSSEDAIPEAELDAPSRGCIIFADLTGKVPDGSHQTTRIEIEDSAGIVKRGSLQVIELAAPVGSQCTFAGTFVVRYGKGLNATRIEDALTKALALIPSIGAYKSAGFGEVLQGASSLTEKASERFALAPAASAPASPTVHWFEMVLDRPLIVDAHRLVDNIFESSTIIPGAAIKGAMARRLELAGLIDERQDNALSAALEQLVISHAFPVDPATVDPATGAICDLPVPMSVVVVEDINDKSLHLADSIKEQHGKGAVFLTESVKHPANDSTKELIQSGAEFHYKPTEFAHGAKDRIVNRVRQDLRLTALSPVKLSRTHVKIDAERLTAVDGQLFAMVAISNKIPVKQLDGNTKQQDLRWRFRVNTGNCTDANEAGKLLSLFIQPVDGIGRSGSTATVSPMDEPPDSGDIKTQLASNFVDVVLRTPALLTGPRYDANQQKTIFDAHAEYFAAKLSGTILKNIFASREMAGGYIATRRRVFGRSTYYPFILTAPGSVFRLDVSAPGAREALENALRFGLPAADMSGKTLTIKPLTWRDCAYVPENGYGEIAIHDLNLPPDPRFEFVGGV